MSIVTVKNKFQVVIPRSVRKVVRVSVGDVLDAQAQGGTIVFRPKTIVDRDIAEGLLDAKTGRAAGPFGSAREANKYLDSRRSKKRRRSRK